MNLIELERICDAEINNPYRGYLTLEHSAYVNAFGPQRVKQMIDLLRTSVSLLEQTELCTVTDCKNFACIGYRNFILDLEQFERGE